MSFGVIGGVASAAAAAACFDGGLTLQALDAREAPVEHGLQPKLLARLVRRRRWVAGTALAIAGWPFHLLALGLAPLSLVQPTLALGLVLLFYLGHHMLGERVGGMEMMAVAGVVGAVAVLAWAAPPETTHHAGSAHLLLGMIPLGVIGFLPLAAAPGRADRRRNPSVRIGGRLRLHRPEQQAAGRRSPHRCLGGSAPVGSP